MKIQNIKKRLEIINEKIDRIEELESYILNAKNLEYYDLYGSNNERARDIQTYRQEIGQIENAIESEIELLNTLK